MSLPTAVFLDTSVLAGQQYNFGSAALTSFIPVAKQRKLSLLLPDPTKREIMRQIRDRSVEALRALEDARRRAPFLTKWKHFPKLPESEWGDWEVKRVAQSEWEAFLKQFTVIELGYESIRLEVVMSWYDGVRAPFREGKKRKEFPDAFAIAALAAFAEKTSTYVAVVSEDSDFKAACDRFPYLLYFPSLPTLTELLVGEEGVVDSVRQLVLGNQTILESAVFDELGSVGFYHADSKYKDIEDVETESVIVEDVRIVGLGSRDCTVTFEGSAEFRVKLEWEEDRGEYYEPYRESERVRDNAFISGTAKIRISSDRAGIEEVTFLELDQSELEVTAEP